jgi:hypothetical protein
MTNDEERQDAGLDDCGIQIADFGIKIQNKKAKFKNFSHFRSLANGKSHEQSNIV